MLTTEQMEIRELARDFAAGEIRPASAQWDADRVLAPSLREKLAELGFYGMRVPEADGGLGLDRSTFLVALEELAWGDAAAALPVALHNCVVVGLLAEAGSPGQRSEWLSRLAGGERLGVWAVAEDGGEDLSTTTTRALRERDDWILSGRKSWVVMAAPDGLLVVAARTGDDPGAVGLFLVAADADGVVVGPPANTLGLRALPIVDVTLRDVRVSGEALVGSADGAGALLERVGAEYRLGLAAIALGIARSAAEHATRYARERTQFGQAIASFEAVQEKLGGMATRITATRALLHHAASALPGPAPTLEGGGLQTGAAMARLVAGETAEWVASQAVQIFGGYGYMRDYPVEKLMRDAQATQILGGTPELLRLVVARAVLEEAAQGE
jgi:alkylation response protein AidB-like acyl-CoA dehydrogenase